MTEIEGSIPEILDYQAEELSDRLRSGIVAASRWLQDELRRQVASAGLGAGLARSWGRSVYPSRRRRTLHPAALVYSRSPLLHEVFARGASISPRRAGFLTIPTAAGERMGLGLVSSSRKGGSIPGNRLRRYADLGAWADRMDAEIVSASVRGGSRPRGSRRSTGPRVVLIPRPGGRMVAVYQMSRAVPGVVVATLVPRVTIAKRLDVDAARVQAEAVLAAEIGA